SKLSKYLTYNIRAGTPVNRLTRDMTNMLLPDREVLSSTVPLGVNLSFDPSRFARAEITNPYTEATFAISALHPFVGGIDWALSIRHPKVDICDRLATIGMSGNRLRPPYPINSAPRVIADSHIGCICEELPFIGDRPDLEGAYQRGETPPFTPLSALFAV